VPRRDTRRARGGRVSSTDVGCAVRGLERARPPGPVIRPPAVRAVFWLGRLPAAGDPARGVDPYHPRFPCAAPARSAVVGTCARGARQVKSRWRMATWGALESAEQVAGSGRASAFSWWKVKYKDSISVTRRSVCLFNYGHVWFLGTERI